MNLFKAWALKKCLFAITKLTLQKAADFFSSISKEKRKEIKNKSNFKPTRVKIALLSFPLDKIWKTGI